MENVKNSLLKHQHVLVMSLFYFKSHYNKIGMDARQIFIKLHSLSMDPGLLLSWGGESNFNKAPDIILT